MPKAAELAQVPFQAIRGTQLADQGWRFSVWTPELTADQVIAMTHVGSQGGYLVAKPNSLNPEDIPLADAPVESGTKTPGQRLRAVIYVLWEQQGAKGNFESYYQSRMEQHINVEKEKLS